jgi:hypothetical protein
MHASIVFIIFKVESMFVFTFILYIYKFKIIYMILYIVGLSWTIFYALYAHIIIN